MAKRFVVLFSILYLMISSRVSAQEDFPVSGPQYSMDQELLLRTNLVPWIVTVPNIGAEYCIGKKWSLVLDVMYCPWKLSDRFSLKTVALLPEGRWWIKSNRKGSFFNIHLDVAWYNVRMNSMRYQDRGRPLLGVGLGYGYRLEFNRKWGMEFEVGAGVANARYDRFYNVDNGALKDTRVSTYFGIDRAAVTLVYYLCDL